MKNSVVKVLYANRSTIGVFLLCFVFFCVLGLYFGSILSVELSRCQQYIATDTKEIAFTKSPTDGECFANLNGQVFLMHDNTNISADVFMCFEESQYKDSPLGFHGEMDGDNECFISENLAREYGLRVGDKLCVYKSEIEYTIRGMLKAQSGLDPKYMHDGVIVIQYNEDIATDKVKGYVSFHDDSGAYFDLETLIVVEDELRAHQTKLAGMYGIMIASLIVVFTIGELLSGQARKHYKLCCKYGQKTHKTYCLIARDLCFKYACSFAMSWIISIAFNKSFIETFMINGLIICAIQLLLSIVIASIYVTGVKRWIIK